jgi:membrane-bound lytic murein transglycosylase D
MFPDRPDRPSADALAASGKALALAICVALAGCQSAAPRMAEPIAAVAEPKPRLQRDAWLALLPAETVHEDIWERIRDGFLLQEHINDNPRIEQQRLLLVSQPRSVELSTERGAPYIHYIVEQLEERNMPLELALLPVIESSYNPFAYSPAQAVGLWQFIPSTGRHFNLRQTSWYDGRRDITASTAAALRYLSYLHGLFNDDWLLALAAYNAGEGTVSRAIERNQKLGLPTDYWNLPLPQETRNYVPKLLALSQLVQTPESFGLNLSPIANEPYFEVVSLKHRLDLGHVAAMLDLDEQEVYQLNPAFTRRVTLDGPQQLLVPTAKAEMLAASLALMKPQQLVDWKPYKVRPGDTLGSISSRHQVPVSTLREVNRLDNDQLRIGRMLSIPASAEAQPAARPQPVTASREKARPRHYKVRPGDNLWDIAKSQKVSVADLQRWNRLSGSSLKVGQQLALQGGAQAVAAKPAPTYYKVKRGDSLSEIAKRFNVQLANLQNWNPTGTARLRPGQTLTLYLPR